MTADQRLIKLTLTVSQGYLKWWWICEVTEDRHAAALRRFYYIKEDGTRWERSLWWLRTPHLDIHIGYGITVQTIFFTIGVKVEILEMPEVNGAHWQAREIDWLSLCRLCFLLCSSGAHVTSLWIRMYCQSEGEEKSQHL